jgi:hypothetical protein
MDYLIGNVDDEGYKVMPATGFRYGRPNRGEKYFSVNCGRFIVAFSPASYYSSNLLIIVDPEPTPKPRTALEIMHERHQALWNWLADNPEMEKGDWPEWGENGIPEYIQNQCFACQWVRDNHAWSMKSRYCQSGDLCPLDWPSGRCEGIGGLFSDWGRGGNTYTENSKIARQIANLPLKEGIE